MRISLLVIRCRDIEASRNFYESLGMSFVKERHGSGPEHYSFTEDACVFELYPNKGEMPNDNIRLGFTVQNVAGIINKVSPLESYVYAGRRIYVVIDPDGRKVEISE